MNRLRRAIGDRLAAHLLAPRPRAAMVATVAPDRREATVRPVDVVPVEGASRIGMAIKAPTQSNWSHAALFVGSAWPGGAAEPEPLTLIEADLRAGVRAAPRSTPGSAVGSGSWRRLSRNVSATSSAGSGSTLTIQNFLDLARHLLPAPPAPLRWRRRLIACGTGDPSRAICSALIAEAFQSVHHPILPEVTFQDSVNRTVGHCRRELLHIRHHSLYASRDFDMSPHFDAVKPALRPGFVSHGLAWEDAAGPRPERH